MNAVRAETPKTGGQHGASMRRTMGFGMAGGLPEFVDAMEDVVIAVMIEKAPAVENLEALLSVGGIDMVQFGPGDYSMSIGHPGEYGKRASQGGGEVRHRNVVEDGRRAARGNQQSGPGEALSGHGGETLLHRYGRQHPDGLVPHSGRGNAAGTRRRVNYGRS